MLPILAHGALGYSDEFAGAAAIVIFVIVMVISWRNANEAEPEEPND